MRKLAYQLGWFLLQVLGIAVKASVATAAVIQTARCLRVIWL